MYCIPIVLLLTYEFTFNKLLLIYIIIIKFIFDWLRYDAFKDNIDFVR